jgi:hypothetical protein
MERGIEGEEFGRRRLKESILPKEAGAECSCCRRGGWEGTRKEQVK